VCPMRAPQTHEASESAATMRTRPEHALFRPEYCLPGILRCQVKGCGELFVAAAHLRSLKTELTAETRPTKWIPAPSDEDARRRQHAEAHVRACEATLDSATGYFLVAIHLRAQPKLVTAADFGFKLET
jgi:hypothetical protein